MKSKELRIGNLVYYGSELSKVVEIKKDHFCVTALKQNMFVMNDHQKTTSPITINSFHLLKFGFTEYPGEKRNQYEKIVSQFCIGEDKEFTVKFVRETYGGQDDRFIKFYYGDDWITNLDTVHHLQNIYYAIKRKELVYAI